jgi:hypothetical protein
LGCLPRLNFFLVSCSISLSFAIFSDSINADFLRFSTIPEFHFFEIYSILAFLDQKQNQFLHSIGVRFQFSTINEREFCFVQLRQSEEIFKSNSTDCSTNVSVHLHKENFKTSF